MKTHLIDQPPDQRIRGAGHRRTVIGNLVQELVCRIMGWQHLAVNGRQEFCPDANNPLGQPIEIKSSHCTKSGNGKVVIYDWRMAKEIIHAPNLAYAIFCYCAEGKGKSKTTAQFLDRLADCPPVLLLLPSWQVHHVALTECPLNKMKSQRFDNVRNGYTRTGYADGYRNVPTASLHRHTSLLSTITFTCWGRDFTLDVRRTVNPWAAMPLPLT